MSSSSLYISNSTWEKSESIWQDFVFQSLHLTSDISSFTSPPTSSHQNHESLVDLLSDADDSDDNEIIILVDEDTPQPTELEPASIPATTAAAPEPDITAGVITSIQGSVQSPVPADSTSTESLNESELAVLAEIWQSIVRIYQIQGVLSDPSTAAAALPASSSGTPEHGRGRGRGSRGGRGGRGRGGRGRGRGRGGHAHIVHHGPSGSSTGYAGSVQDAQQLQAAMAGMASRVAEQDRQLVVAIKMARRYMPSTVPSPLLAACIVRAFTKGVLLPSVDPVSRAGCKRARRAGARHQGAMTGIDPALQARLDGARTPLSTFVDVLQLSLQDAASRSRVFNMALGFASCIGGLSWAAVMLMAPSGKADDDDILQWSPAVALEAARASAAPPTSSMAGVISSAAAYSELFLRNIGAMDTVLAQDADATALDNVGCLARQITDASAGVIRHMNAWCARGAAGSDASDSVIDLSPQALYKQRLTPLAYQEQPGLHTNHALAAGADSAPPATYDEDYMDAASAYAARQSAPAPWLRGSFANARSVLRVNTDLAALASLACDWECAIFTRVDPARIDLLRVACMGPVDTPYEAGMFLFDIALPYTYPDACPAAKFITTGNGRIRFNPNLYSNGKVCLSLLGTWSGPAWSPQTSSISQLLLACACQILVDKPLVNEPGCESYGSSASGKLYLDLHSACVYLATVYMGMIAHLRAPPAGFESIIQAHFQLKRESILTLAGKWVAKVPDLRARAACLRHVSASSMDSVPLNQVIPQAVFVHRIEVRTAKSHCSMTLGWLLDALEQAPSALEAAFTAAELTA